MGYPIALIMVAGVVIRFDPAGGAPSVRATADKNNSQRFTLPGDQKAAAQWVEQHIDGEADRAAAYAALAHFAELSRIVREVASA